MNQALVDFVAEGLSDYLQQLGVNPDERPEHGGESISQVLARVAIRKQSEFKPTSGCEVCGTPTFGPRCKNHC